MGVSKPNKLVVADIGWAETIPDLLKNAVKRERLIEGFMNARGKGNEEKVGLAEVAVYLYTASLSHPMGHDYAQIYLWVSGKVMEQTKGEAPEFVKDLLKKGLDSDEERLLDQLRRELYRKRGGAIRSPIFDALKALGKKIEKEGNE